MAEYKWTSLRTKEKRVRGNHFLQKLKFNEHLKTNYLRNLKRQKYLNVFQ